MKKDNETVLEYHINKNVDEDVFVGIRSDGEKIQACFPFGYNLGNSDVEKKKDVQLLIRVLSRFAGIKEKLLPQLLIKNPETVNFPIQAYITVLAEYCNRNGYYTENEVVYRTNNKRPANWSRTIKQKTAYPQGESYIYLNTVARESIVDSSQLITKINQFCVEESYNKIGWLLPVNKPHPSGVVFDEKRFLIKLREKLSQTNNDKDKALFNGMINMLQYVGKKGLNAGFYFGTNEFEYVWEKLIDFNFGIYNKKDYFPKTSWYLKSAGIHAKSALEPDTIMLANGKVFILDAKYYKYGATENPAHLPKSTSINKQITYGEYVATEAKFKDENGVSPKVYNVFLMPYNKSMKPFKTEKDMYHIGEARGDWKVSGAEYERVQGILLDTKWMMTRAVRKNVTDINALAWLVENFFKDAKAED
ncbi:LlaJI restriction endonuclease [Clostridium sp. ASBs410]|nr:LlaJI restriction endonuclease [Clostridium sp. ASBs410]